MAGFQYRSDDVVLAIGKRLEGAIFACQTFIERVAMGLGALLAGLLLTLVGVWRLPTTESTQAILRAADDHYRSSALNP